VGRDSSVGLATHYGLDGWRIETRWGEIICTCPDWPWGPPSLLYNGYRVFPGGKANLAWPSHPYMLKKVYNYNFTPIRSFVVCSRANFTFKQYKEREFWMCYTVRNWQEFSAVGRHLKSVMGIWSVNGSWPVTALWLVGDGGGDDDGDGVSSYNTGQPSERNLQYFFIRVCFIWNGTDIFNRQSGHFLLQCLLDKQ